MNFKNWAQPVVSRPWGVVAIVLDRISAWTGYRTLSTAKHRAWERACGLEVS